MNAAEFRCLYEYLGLTREWVAANLTVTLDTITRWEDGTEPIPASAAVDLGGLSTMTSKLVHELATRLRWGGTITTYQTDAEFRIADPYGLTYPAPWHRAVAARVADRAVDVNIQFSGEGHDPD